MFWIVLISVVALTLLWILTGPVYIYLDTLQNRYYVTLPGIFRVAVVPNDHIFLIRIWLFFIPFNINPLEKRAGNKKDRSDIPSKKNRNRKLSGGLKGGLAMIRAFRIRELHLNLDTDDFMLNTQLVPVFSAINNRNIHMQVNFEGNASLRIDLRTHLAALFWAIARNKYKSMYNQ